MKKLLLSSTLAYLLIFGNPYCCAQSVGISGQGSVPDNSALLDIDATGMSPKKGLLIPRLTTTERDAIGTPANSLIVFNTTNNCLQIYMNVTTSWENIYCSLGCSGAPTTPASITGIAAACQNASGVSYSIAQVSGATSYSWSVPTGATITAGQGTTGIVVTFATTSGNVTVTASNSCGTSAAQTLAVTLQTLPAQPSVIGGSGTICANQSGVAYSVTNVAGVTYSWTYSGSGYTCASNCASNSITANFSSATAGTLTVTPSNSCGNGTARTSVLTITAAPSSAPTAGTHTPGNTQIIWNWSTVAGATGYKWNTVNTYGSATDNGASTSYTQTGLSTLTSYTLYAWAYNSCGNSSAVTLTSATGGESVYLTAGTYTWNCPTGVTSVCVVCVGGGAGNGRGGGSGSSGGSGGGLGWKNNIAVTPGNNYTVVVGAGGAGVGGASSGAGGGDSYFINTSTVKGGGGGIANNWDPGYYVGDGGGNGGSDGSGAAGGGGAGGYSGTGGSTGAGAGGGGGGSNYGTGTVVSGQDCSGGGGGTGLYGTGTNGARGTSGNTANYGLGGSGGNNGSLGDTSEPRGGNGGSPGGGGGCGGYDNSGPLISYTGGNGAPGGVRILWGTGRSFPSNAN